MMVLVNQLKIAASEGRFKKRSCFIVSNIYLYYEWYAFYLFYFSGRD